MAVLEHDPVSVFAARFNEIVGFLGLTLSERDALESLLIAHTLGVLQ